MAGSAHASSDDLRSGAPLRHARTARLDAPLELELGGVLSEVEVAYETYGALNAARDNAVLVCHAISGDSHVARHDASDAAGWWDVVVGPGGPIDTDRHFVLCANVLGGCRGTTGPGSVNSATGRPWGAEFPDITLGDIVEVQRRLLDRLGVARLRAVVGGSMGGHQAIAWAARHPGRVGAVIALATSPRLTSQALAFDIVGRNAILRDPHYAEGQYYGRDAAPATGLALARMLGHITYLSREAMTEKFDADRLRPRQLETHFEKRFSVGSYLAHQGKKFVERFDANSYLTLTRAMDGFDLGASVPAIADALRGACDRWLIVSFTSDWLFPSEQSRQLVNALSLLGKRVSYCDVRSDCGHDAFLLEDEVHVYGEMIRAFLQPPVAAEGGAPAPDQRPTSIFGDARLDLEELARLVPAGASVLDLGCGTGDLLAALHQRDPSARRVGIELDESLVLGAVRRGFDVIQADLNRPLTMFAAGQFDVVVLSQTLQAIIDVGNVVDEMLRVGRRTIVSFPNFAHHRLRQMLFEQGRSPRGEGLYQYEWHDSPNRRFPTILDFRDFCAQRGIRIERDLYLDTTAGREVRDDPNWGADLAIFVLSRPG